ncbi:MAG: DUF2461 domain-containing protein [Gammaproteobacteria bacterium]|nr:DUF2461 domain-containing protein [Gammaproteobacteria bacterium]
MPARYARFYPETIRFLEQLAANNNRDWFNENKRRYEDDVLDVALRFIQSMQDPLADIAPHFVATPTRMGGSLMRVYRDTRFSHNKTPYKTNIGIQFRHEQAKDVHSPGYYLHVDPNQVFVGVGMWRPDAEPLRNIRQRIAARPGEWQRVMSDRGFKRHFDLGGESLVRPPRGFDKDHECIEDIKRKSFIAGRELDVNDCLKPQFQRTVESSFKTAEPFMRFLCKAVGVRF